MRQMTSKIVACALFALAVQCEVFAGLNANEVIARAMSNIVSRLSANASKTNHVRAIASPENYALLKSTKLTDAAKKLALQKKLAEAALADADNNEADRLKWHGTYASQKVDIDKLTATFVHADGYEVTVNFSRPVLEDDVKNANKALPKMPMTNGVPIKLANARMRRYREKVTPVVTVSIETDANSGKNLRPSTDR